MKKLDETWRPERQFQMSATVGFSANHAAKKGSLDAVGNTLYLPNGTWIAFPGCADLVTMITETCDPKVSAPEVPEGLVAVTTFVTKETADLMTRGTIVGYSIGIRETLG